MVNTSNKLFWDVLGKVEKKVESYSIAGVDALSFGVCDKKEEDREVLLNAMEYLMLVRDSTFEYHYIEGLTLIDNLLKTL